MKRVHKIGVLFNVTEKHEALLKALRMFYPDSRITAVVPARTPIAPADMPEADEVLPLELSPSRLIFRGVLFDVVRQLSELHFDLFILRFGTLKLRLLAAMLQPARCELWFIGGIIAPVEAGGIVPAAKEFFQRWWWGRKTVLSAWCSTHFQRVRPYSQRK